MARSEAFREVLDREVAGQKLKEWYSIRFDYLPQTPIDRVEWTKDTGMEQPLSKSTRK